MTNEAPMATQSIRWEVEFSHRPEKVWRALTDPQLLALWLMRTDFQPMVGGRFTFRSDPTPWWDGIVNSEVVALELHRRLQYTWKSGPDTSPLDTVVTWTLTPTPSGGTRLTLEHTGFQPTQGHALGGARDGWKRMVDVRLREVLAGLEG